MLKRQRKKWLKLNLQIHQRFKVKVTEEEDDMVGKENEKG